MKKNIELLGQNIEYILRRSNRARRIRFAIYCGGEFVVTVPYNFRESDLERFLIEKADWILEKMREFKSVKKIPSCINERRDFLIHRQRAMDLVRKKIKIFNNIYNFDFDKIKIKRQRTSWGSCSKRNNLNFNYRLAFLPEHIVDYIVVHELCHLGEFNHSGKFWDLVGKTIPDYLNIRKELKRYSLGFEN